MIAQLGGKSGEDVVVPLDRLAEAIEETVEIGAPPRPRGVSWGHAGDGNLHSNFLVDPARRRRARPRERAAEELFAMAIALGGSVSGEHGIGWLKRGQLERQWAPRASSSTGA